MVLQIFQAIQQNLGSANMVYLSASNQTVPEILYHAHQNGHSFSGAIAGINNVPHLSQHVLQLFKFSLEGSSQAGSVELLGSICESFGSGCQILNYAVPVPKALVARLAIREGAREATGTLITANA